MKTPAPAPDPTPDASPAAQAAPDRLYQLQTPGELQPAVTLGLGLPAHVNGLPAFYYWKDAILVGTYHHPSGRFSLSMTRQKLDQLVRAFQRMRANGVKVPILMDHAPTAAATLGWIVDVKRRGDRLLELHQFLGPAARDVGLRNQVSLGIDPAFTDGRGEQYGEAIVHSAITPLPVVPGQDGFEPVERTETGEDAKSPITLSLVDAAPALESSDRVPSPGTPEDTYGEQGGGEGDFERRTVLAEPDHPHPDPLPDYRERGSEGDPVTAQAGEPRQPASVPSVTPGACAAALTELTAKRDTAVARGCLTPAAADELLALLSQANTHDPLLLSTPADAGGAPLAAAIFDALARHRPPAFGEQTGIQLLTRLIPGQDDDRLELRDRMIALASGR